MLEEKFKIKPLTKYQILISLDRLTRFKFTEDKYLRVFKDIITSNLIYPKYKKKELELVDYDVLVQIVQKIFDVSLNVLKIPPSKDFTINKKLLEYEKSVFHIDENIQKLLKNKIDYKAALVLLEDKDLNFPVTLNLKWLKTLASDVDQQKNKQKNNLKFPLEKIVLVEGITEEILLPKVAKICGLDFDKAGINLISAGGKNQVVKLFYYFAPILKLPIFILLDNDAEENFEEIMPKLRKNDKIHVLLSGEFEDTLPLSLIKRTLNKQFDNYSSVKLEDLRKNTRMTKTLEDVFKARGLEFKKAEFAYFVSENISNKKDVSEEIELIISKLKN